MIFCNIVFLCFPPVRGYPRFTFLLVRRRERNGIQTAGQRSGSYAILLSDSAVQSGVSCNNFRTVICFLLSVQFVVCLNTDSKKGALKMVLIDRVVVY